MQVNALSSLLQTLLASPARETATARFLPEPVAQPQAMQPSIGTPAQSVQMLVALAAASAPPELERRRRLAQKAQRGLDALEMLQAALVVGVGSAAPTQELRSWLEESSPRPEDPELAQIMDEIDLRIQVELAKRERE